MTHLQETAQPGDRIGGRYEILGLLGKGGFGVVYHARSLGHGREFALKTYLQSSLDRRATARFRQESEIWIALGTHPYLVQAYFADQIDGRLYVGMELIQPGASGHNNMEAYLNEESPSLEQWLQWGVQLCHGMEYAALRGIRAHRDLKPSNIMINAAGHVKVNDFGLATQPVATLDERGARASEEGRELFRGQTMHGIGFGTPTHMAPEQFEDAAACDARSDIYSVGVILYQAMTGQLPVTVPWPTDTSLQSRLQFWNDMAAAHRRFEPAALGTPLDEVLRRCLATEPDRRYPDFAALRRDLEHVQRSHGFALVEQPMVRPLSAKGWLARGRSLARIGRFPQAIHAFEQALARQPQNELALVGKADALLAIDRPTDAQPLFDALLRAHPDHATACAGKARCLHYRGYLQEALDLFERAVGLHAADPDIWIHRGSLLRAMGKVEAAMESVDRALEQEPSHVEGLTRKAALLATGNRFSDALLLFERALSVNPLHAPAACGQAVCLVRAGRYDEALPLLRSLDRAGDLGPRHHLAWIEALSRSGQSAKALTRLEALSGTALADEAARMRAQILVDVRRLDEALSAWEQSSSRATTEIFRTQGQVLNLLCGRESTALKLSSILDNESSAGASAYAATCGAAMHSGQDQQALDACERGLSHHPRSALLWHNRGIVLTLLQRFEEAALSFFNAARTSSDGVSEAARTNADLLGRIHACLPKDPGPLPNGAPHIEEQGSLLSDDILPSHPISTLRIHANGWHPRYRVPHLRPTLYLFPRYLPADLAG